MRDKMKQLLEQLRLDRAGIKGKKRLHDVKGGSTASEMCRY
jgi:hypothetical protein